MYLTCPDSPTTLRLCPRLLWEIGRHGDIDVAAPARPRYRWPGVTAQVWSSNDRWFVDRERRHRDDDEYGYRYGWDRGAVTLDGAPLDRAAELVHGSVLEIEYIEYRVVREPDDPPRAGTPGIVYSGLGALRPAAAVEAFANGDLSWIDSLVILASHPSRWPRLRDVLRAAAEHADGKVRAAGLRGLMALASSGGVEPGVARRAIAAVTPDAELVLRMGAARALFEIDPLAAAPKLLSVIREALVEGELPAAAAECARVLARSEDSRAIEEVVREARAAAADAPARKRRALAARVLGELANVDGGLALRALRALVSDPHESVRFAAARAAAGAGAVEALIDALVDGEHRVRSEALAALRALPGSDERLLLALDASPAGSSRQNRLLDALDRLTAPLA